MKTKKLLALLMAAVMVLGVLPMTALATSDEVNQEVEVYSRYTGDALLDAVWATPGNFSIESSAQSDIPAEYGADHYTEASCLNIVVSGVEDDASISFSMHTHNHRINANNEDFFSVLSFVGPSLDEAASMSDEELDDMFAEIMDDVVENYSEADEAYAFNVQLVDGAGQLVVFYYHDIWDYYPDVTPVALVLNFYTDSAIIPDPGLEPDPEPDPDPELGSHVLIKAVTAYGQFENENVLYGLVPGALTDIYGMNATCLIVPKNMATVDVTLTFNASNYSVTLIDIAQGPISTTDRALTVTLKAAPKLYTNALSDDSKNVIRVTNGSQETTFTIWAVNQRFDDLPDRVVDYLCIGSQYTNNQSGGGDYGTRPIRSLVGSNYTMGGIASGPVSLGNFGGYITYYYEDAITDNPNNAYGIDFITFGNSVEGSNEFGEVGQVWVSENGTEWYALAGGMHYENYADWDYSVTYTKLDDGSTAWVDNRGKSGMNGDAFPTSEYYPWHIFEAGEENSITLTGIYFPEEADQNEYGNTRPPFAGFGYTDMGQLGTVLPSDDTSGWGLSWHLGPTESEEAYDAMARNLAGNPYLPLQTDSNGRVISYVTDGMDLAWAVDADGQPVTFQNGIHYVKIATATNIYNKSLGEKSTEVNMVRVAQANAEPVGKTDAPAKITVDGVDVALEDGTFVYDVTVDGPFKVAVDAPEDANIYINNNCAAAATYDAMPLHQIIRVIVQEGEKEPYICILNLTETTETPAASATLTLDANGGTVNGNATYTFKFDANMSGDPLPDPVAPNSSVTFGGWYMGQRRFDVIPAEIQDTTLTALWIPVETPPADETISVSFRLIGSTLSTGDVDVANGDYKGAEYVTWIPTTAYEVDENATVADLFVKATNAAGIRSVGADRGYVTTVYAPDVLGGYALSEMTNGPRSGWMYTMDGAHANAINTQTMHDGAEIVFHYVNDYAWEVEDWGTLGGSGWPQLSDEENNCWNKWLEAADVAPYVPPVIPEPDDPTPTEPTEPEPEPKKYEDVAEDAWYAGAVDFVSARGLFLGVSETKFGPELPMTRAMLVTVLWRMEGQPAPGAAAAFEDVPADQWYADAVAWAAENGIVKGVGHNRFAPDVNVTREQFAAMLYRYAQYKGEGFTGAWYFPLAFDDAAEISDWADEAMHWCVMNGVITGRTESTLVPRGDAKCAEAAAMLERFVGLLAE